MTKADPQSPTRDRALLFAVLAALALRLLVSSISYTSLLDPGRNHWAFGYETGRVAESIATGHGIANPFFAQTGPTALLPPLYEYLVAGVFKLFGVFTAASALVILSLQSLFAALTCIPIFLIAKRWFGERTAQLSTWIWALFPFGVYLAGAIVWDYSLTALVLTTLLWFTIDIGRRRGLWVWVGYGLLWGIAALLEPSMLAVLPLMAAWALWRGRGGWRAPTAVTLAVILACVAPWEVRNYKLFHRWTPLRDGFWLEVWVGNNGDTIDRWTNAAHPAGSAIELHEYNTMGEVRYIALKRKQALSFIERNLGEFIWLSVRRFFFTWTGYWSFQPAYVAEYPYDSYNILLITPLTVLMLFGLCEAFRHRREGVGLLASILVAYPAVYYVTHTSLKYRHPIDPEILMLAAFAIVSLRDRSRGKKGVARPDRREREIPAEFASDHLRAFSKVVCRGQLP